MSSLADSSRAVCGLIGRSPLTSLRQSDRFVSPIADQTGWTRTSASFVEAYMEAYVSGLGQFVLLFVACDVAACAPGPTRVFLFFAYCVVDIFEGLFLLFSGFS